MPQNIEAFFYIKKDDLISLKFSSQLLSQL
ncbi:hypothetical protein SAMN05444267_1004167 [Chryseobacterium polytrichastri]|uniref:Uncharacterized protein n=1 Tax=Chryseobacterium polytrichastri TaxID=1302687 RepID=A0A1M6SYF4_9FLAO|nr:hypothetical protein SAMN05444267_1004167 [Chryseobacterium polytrichastri]